MDPDDARVVDPRHVLFDVRNGVGIPETLLMAATARNAKTQRSQAPCPSLDGVVSAVSNVRRICPTDHDWLLSVERAVDAVVVDGPRCRAVFIDARNPEEPRIWTEPRPNADEAVESVRNLVSTWPRGSARGFVRRLLSGATCFTVSARLDEELYRKWASDAKARDGASDALCVAACVAPGVGALLWFPLPSRATLPRATCQRWEQVARALLKAVEARFGDVGRGEAASELSNIGGPAALGVRERARERLSSGSTPMLSPGEASLFRCELLRGEWSLLDHFDRDGKRYFTWARDTRRQRALTKRERDVLERVANGQADRLIAQELRCSPSTVATHRLRAMSKLGLNSRALFSQILASVVEDALPS